MKLTYGVITWVPDPEKNDGNLYAPLVYGLRSEIQRKVLLYGRLEVFTLGEILLLSESGREICGRCRKPSKWLVNCEKFDTLEEAIVRTEGVLRGELGEPVTSVW